MSATIAKSRFDAVIWYNMAKESEQAMTDKERFVEALKSTGRTGVERVLSGLEELGFFEAPASTRFHGSVPGGLLAHSLSVYDQALAVREVEIAKKPELAQALPLASVTIAALLHDVCKAEVYKEVEKFRKDKDGKWEKYKTYGVDYSSFPFGHGEKSVIRLLKFGLEMTDEEMLAIRWHMQGFDLSDSPEARGNYGAACDKTPLVGLVMAADMLASHVMDV